MGTGNRAGLPATADAARRAALPFAPVAESILILMNKALWHDCPAAPPPLSPFARLISPDEEYAR